MKKTSMILGMLIAGSSIAFAAGAGREGIKQNILRSFQTDFRAANDVAWTETATCYKATFRSGDQVMFAYYDKSRSELIALTRNLTCSQLPMNLQKGLKERLAKSWMSELFEVAAAGETTYYATLENGDQKIVLKSSESAGWQVMSRSVK